MTDLAASYAHGAADEPLLGHTIGQALERAATTWPDHVALVAPAQRIRWTWRELRDRADAIAAGLLALGLRRGERVGIWSLNRAEWALTQFAAAKAGLILVTINPAYRLSELEYALNKVGCAALVMVPTFKTSDYTLMVNTLAPELAASAPGQLSAARLPQLRIVVQIGGPAAPGTIAFDELAARGGEAERAELRELSGQLQFDDAVNIQFTSGTTGSPKGVALTHHNILNNGYFVGRALRLSETDRICIPVPLYHCFGMVMGNLAAVTHGAAMVYPGEGFDPVATLETVQAEGCTALYAVPTMFIAMLDHPEFARFDLSTLRTGIMAGTACPLEIMRRVVERMNMSQITICYGMTETSRRLVMEEGGPNRRLYETAVLATLRDKLRSGDVWVERSASYRRFDSYLLPPDAVPAVMVGLKLPATADEWLAGRAGELDRRLKRFSRRLLRGELEGVELRDGRLHVAPVKTTATPETRAFADGIEAMMPPARITELLYEVNRMTGFASAFTNLRTGERCDDENALLAAILADATNLGLGRMAAASHGVTRDKLIWTADAYIRPETYKAALAKIIGAHHALPIASTWGDGTTSSSDRQFFRSAKRGDAAGEVNARYGHDPGLGFYTHVSDQHGPYSVRVMSATSHEAPYVLDGLLHHGTALRIGTHYTDTGGASDHVFILCAMLGFRFCPRLRDLPDRKLATIEPATAYKDLDSLIGRRVKADVIREHWGEILRLVASLQAGTVLPSAMLRRLAAYQRQNQLDLALQELGRVERTLFMLDWLESPKLRQRCQAGLNKSEQRHALAQVICTFKQGRIADRGQEAQQFRASGLNLVIAAIVYWNSTYLADAVQHLRDQGKPILDALLAHTSPLTWEHIGFSGDFLWDRAAATAGHRRPLNLGRDRMAA